jgi:hypothetical protein
MPSQELLPMALLESLRGTSRAKMFISIVSKDMETPYNMSCRVHLMSNYGRGSMQATPSSSETLGSNFNSTDASIQNAPLPALHPVRPALACKFYVSVHTGDSQAAHHVIS